MITSTLPDPRPAFDSSAGDRVKATLPEAVDLAVARATKTGIRQRVFLHRLYRRDGTVSKVCRHFVIAAAR